MAGENIKVANERFMNWLATPGQEKRAMDFASEFTRYRMREESFFRRVLPMVPKGAEDLDRQSETDDPVIVVDREPDSPAAISVPFATLPMGYYIWGNRYRVTFARILTPQFTKDVEQLHTYDIDIRQVLSDNSIKDIAAEEDRKFLLACQAAMGGVADGVAQGSGVVQWETIYGGITRDTLQDAFKVLPRTISRLEVNKVLLNNLTAREVLKFTRNESGGDVSQDLFMKGWSSDFNPMNSEWIITIKQELVGDNTMYMFADPKFIGVSFSLVDTTMFIERRAFMLSFFSYQTIGSTIGNSNSISRVDFA